MKRILFFGIYNPEYARTRILTEGFTAAGYDIVSCRIDPAAHPGMRKYIALWREGRKHRFEPFEKIFVLFPGHTVVWLARLIFGHRIIFDAFVSLHDSNVHDRGRYGPRSFGALKDWLLDWSACLLAKKVLTDTDMHRRYFVSHLHVLAKKLITVPVGASGAWLDAGAQAHKRQGEEVLIGFYGTYIPLHGVPTIVRAAKLLEHEPIRFRLIGGGQEYATVQLLAEQLGGLPNIEFLHAMPREELIEQMQAVDVCLGIFGSTNKTARVVPNKVYECAALGKPIITANTPGIREVFTDQQDIFLCEAASPEALAEAVRTLATDESLRNRLGKAARERILTCCTPAKIVAHLLETLGR